MLRKVFSTIPIILASLSVFFLLEGAFSRANPDWGRPSTITDQDLLMFEKALESYKEITGNYPSQDQGLRALVSKPTVEPVPERWVALMRETISDPWGGEYRYHFPETGELERPVIISAGPDRTFGTENDLSSAD